MPLPTVSQDTIISTTDGEIAFKDGPEAMQLLIETQPHLMAWLMTVAENAEENAESKKDAFLGGAAIVYWFLRRQVEAEDLL